MANPGWSGTESPFHRGELAIQARLGIQERMDKQGRRVIRNYLPDQFQQSFAQLSYVIVGTIDAVSSPWASILVGEPGFLSAPSDRTLQVAAKPLFGDPLATTLASGIDIGLLGIELHTRRRNRLNGTVTGTHADGFEVQVRQSFGNCPQYIQARRFELGQDRLSLPKLVHQTTALGTIEQSMITAADTFFIATAYQYKLAGAASGVDVSHRGGKPGFVRIDDHQTLTIAREVGNGHFNTFGNLELNPRAGLLFVDFGQGNLLYLTGTAEVIWKDAEVNGYEGAERVFRFRLHQEYWTEGSFPLRGSEPEFPPFLNRTGSW